MSDYLVRQIEDMDNIEVLLDTGVVSVEGEDHLERITAKNSATGETETATAHSLFVFIGAAPKTEWLDGVVERDERGFILSGPDLMQGVSVPRAGGQIGTRSCLRLAYQASSSLGTCVTARSSAAPRPSARAQSPSSSSTST